MKVCILPLSTAHISKDTLAAVSWDLLAVDSSLYQYSHSYCAWRRVEPARVSWLHIWNWIGQSTVYCDIALSLSHSIPFCWALSLVAVSSNFNVYIIFGYQHEFRSCPITVHEKTILSSELVYMHCCITKYACSFLSFGKIPCGVDQSKKAKIGRFYEERLSLVEVSVGTKRHNLRFHAWDTSID